MRVGINSLKWMLFCYSFFAAGFLQFIGVFPLTAGVLFICLVGMLWGFGVSKQVFRLSFQSIITFIFIFYVISVGVYTQTSFSKTSLYLSYVVFPVVIKFIINESHVKVSKSFKFLFIVLLIQVPVLLLQNYLGQTLIGFSAKPYIYIDRLYGTFPVADDHGLGLFCIVMLGLSLYVFKLGSIKRAVLLIVSGLCVFFIESNISKLLYVLLLSISFLRGMKIYVSLSLFQVLLILVVMILFFQPLIDLLTILLDKEQVGNFDFDTIIRRTEMGLADRFQTVVFFFLSKSFFLIGNGPFSYFDPFAAEFQFNLNFSQFIWFYYDIGLIGVVLFLLFIGSLFTSYETNFRRDHFFNFLVLCFLVYSFFTTTLNSTTVLTLTFFTLKAYYAERRDCATFSVRVPISRLAKN